MSGETGPPRMARLLAYILIPSEIRDEMEGDLLEGHGERRREFGRSHADSWYWRQVLSMRPGALRQALRRRSRTEDYQNRKGGHMEGWGLDLRNGWRFFMRRPGASLAVVGTIALAVAATTTVFTVVNGVLLRPLPFHEPQELVRIFQTNSEWADSPNEIMREMAQSLPVSVPIVTDWESESSEFEAMGAYASQAYVYRGSEGAEFLDGASVNSGFFQALGVQPLIGRGINPDDDSSGAEPVAVLSHGTWISRFGGDPQVLGQPLVLGSTAYSVVGVMPEGFGFPSPEEEFWVSIRNGSNREDRSALWMNAIGRLRQGVSLEAARSEMEAIQARLAEAYPDDQGQYGVRLLPLLDSMVGEVGSTLWFLLGSVSLALLVACVNIANVLSVMGLSRRQEFALKSAIGAGRGRLVRGQLVESAFLATIGGIVGLGLTTLVLPFLLALLPPDIPRQESIGMDPAVLGFGFGLTFFTALLVGLYPAVQSGLSHPGGLLRGSGRALTGGRRAARVRDLFVVSEVALAVVLLIGAGLLGNSFTRLWTVDRGFATEGLVAMSVVPDRERFPEREDRDRFFREFRQELSTIPNLAITAAKDVPLNQSTSFFHFTLENAVLPEEEFLLVLNVVLDNYFQVMEIPVVEGREFDLGDTRDGPPVAIVSQTLAEAFWPGESPLGKRLRREEDDPWITIVGVAQDVRHQGLETDPEPKVYLPAEQSGTFPAKWIARAGSNLMAVPPLLRASLRSFSPETPILDMAILEETISESVAVPRFRTLFVCGLAGMAGLLALIGVYGVVSFTVSQRTREIGIRMAVGSDPRQVVWQILRSGLILASVGLVAGLLLAFPAVSVLEEFLFQIRPTDPLTFLGTVLGVGLVCTGATYIPARRAARVDPVTVLKAE